MGIQRIELNKIWRKLEIALKIQLQWSTDLVENFDLIDNLKKIAATNFCSLALQKLDLVHISILAVLIARRRGRLWRYASRLQNYELLPLQLTRKSETVEDWT